MKFVELGFLAAVDGVEGCKSIQETVRSDVGVRVGRPPSNLNLDEKVREREGGNGVQK